MATLEIWTLGPIGLFIGVCLFLILGGVVAVLLGLPYRLVTGREPESDWFYGAVFVVTVVLAAVINFALGG
jgi:hypothetical protein